MWSPALVIVAMIAGLFVVSFFRLFQGARKIQKWCTPEDERLANIAGYKALPSVNVQPRRAALGGELSELDIIQHRAHDLAQTLAHAVEFDGSDLLGTFADSPEVGRELYESGLAAMENAQPGDVLKVQQGVSALYGKDGAPYSTPVRYIIEPQGAKDLARSSRAERWYWAIAPRRCENCGAPNANSTQQCVYCGGRLDEQVRWVVQAIERTDMQWRSASPVPRPSG